MRRLLIKSCLIGSSENGMYGRISSKLKWLIVCLFKEWPFVAFLFCFFSESGSNHKPHFEH